jgi:hypothetical protein
MARKCTICNHGSRLEADQLLRAGRSSAEVARLLGDVTDDAVARHRKKHLDSGVGDKEPTAANALLEECERLSEAAASRDDLRAQILVLREKMRVLDTQSRIPQQSRGSDWVQIGSLAWLDSITRWHDAMKAGNAWPWDSAKADGERN